jgi:predicted enzyme related to lactoylglutathione lyase
MSPLDDRDPLDVLRGDDPPVQPDATFAVRLRRRLEAAADFFESHPNGAEGVVMSDTTTAIADLTSAPTPSSLPPATPRPAALPYLTVADARAAIDWYAGAFGAVPIGDPIVMGDGRIGHAELAIAGGVLYLADEYPELGLRAPTPGATSVSLMLHVPDTDAALARARSRGATVERETGEDHGGRNATIIDPFGHRWMLSGPVTGVVSRIQHGDVGYVSVWTPDADRAARFYGHVLGWTVDPDRHRVTNTALPTGIYDAGPHPTLFCCYAVTDLAAARQAIIDAGGRPGEVEHLPYGTVLAATDPQGTAFAVYQPNDDTARPELNGAGPGELSYITYEVSDAAAFREFYGRVLHWAFEPGRIDDGWQVISTHPMAGVAGGSQGPTTVPMWTVADIEAAVVRVGEAGGTVLTEPVRQPYGLMAECTDDQGGRFYLGEF